MRTEDALREALQREAARHRVNGTLPGSTIVKARASRALTAMVALGAVTAVAFGGVTFVGEMRGDGAREVAPASGGGDEEASRPHMEDTPFLLVTHKGWDVVGADQYHATEGEVTFTNGVQRVDLTWRPAELHEEYVEDRAHEAAQSWDIEIARRHGQLFRYEGTTDFTTLWVDGDLSLELRGEFENVHAYRAISDSLDRVDEERWLAALPEDTVVPGEYEDEVDAMIADVPVHPDADVERFSDLDTVTDRYQLGARVTGAVTCAWVEQWLSAGRDGDREAQREAEEAMATARDWEVLQEMTHEGSWSYVVWEYADAMTGGGEIKGGGPTSIEESYRDAFGCAR